MAEDCLQVKVGDFDSFIVGLNLTGSNTSSYEIFEARKVFTGEYEVWQIRITKDLTSGASSWSYLGKIEGFLR